jgi:hypothetical protein
MESKLLRSLFSQIGADEYIAVRALHSASAKNGDVKSAYVTSTVAVEKFAEVHRNKYDVYFGVCTRSEKKPEAEFASRAYCAWADLDAGSPDVIEKRNLLKTALLHFVLPPSAVVDSGHNGFHLYWFIEPTDALEAVVETNELLEQVLGSDSVADVARILRIEDTYNHKSEPPSPVKLLILRSVRYQLHDVRQATKIDASTAKRVTAAAMQGFKSRSERDWSVIVRLVRLGLSDTAIAAIFQHHKIGDKLEEKNGDKYFEHTLTRARKEAGVDEDTGAAIADSTFAGFFEKDDSYWTMSERGPVQLSTFTFEPEILLQGKDTTEQDVLVGTIRAAGFEWFNITLPRKAFVRGDTLIKELPLAAWQWIGSDRDVRNLLPYLMDKWRRRGMNKRKASSQLGFHDGMWVGTTQTLGPGGVLSVEDAKVVALPSKAERPAVQYSEAALSNVLAKEFARLVQKINRPEVIWPVLGWWAACPFKTRLAEKKVRFPTLNLFGTRGSGKTSLITQVMHPLSGYVEGRTYDCDTTQFVMLSLLGSTNGVPVAFSEYRRTSMRSPERILRYLLLLYDTGHDPRGRPDQSVVDYVLDAPVTVDGEDALSDAASLERIVQVNMHPEDIAEGGASWEAFQELALLDLRTVGTHYITHTLGAEQQPQWDKALQITRAAFDQLLPDRVRRNLAVVVVGMLSLEEFMLAQKVRWPKTSPEFVRTVLQESLDLIVSAETGRSMILVDEFVEDIVNAAAQDGAPPFVFRYDGETNALWFHLSTAMGWWVIRRRMQNKPSLDTAAIKAQLRERSAKVADGPSAGQYILGREAKTVEGRTRWVYGVDVTAACSTGLDVPMRLEQFRVSQKDKVKEASNNGKV